MRVKDVQSSPREELMEQSLEYSRCSWWELMEQIDTKSSGWNVPS